MSRLLATRPISFSILLWGLILSGLVTISRSAEAGPPGGESAIGNPVLVELFTSEGCSSCPPADEFVKKLDASQPVAGAQLIILSEHVDYWDHDGWKDPNSSHALTERQSAYVRELGLSTPYTPQIIVDGTHELKLADLQLVGETFEKAASAPKIPVRITGVALSEGNPGLLKAHIDADGASSQHNADLYVAVALDHVESQVLRGENGGRNLTHVAVVQQIVKVGKLGKGRSFAQDVQLKVKPATTLHQIRIVAFAQESGPGKLLGAALWKSVH